MLGISSTTFNLSMLRRFNVWYSVKDGNWSDPAVWTSNGKKKHKLPQPGDDVYINHTVTCDLSPYVRNLYVAGILKFDAVARVLSIIGDLQASGTVDQSAGGNTIVLGGVNNRISNYTSGTSGIVIYGGDLSQAIMPLSYRHLQITSGILYNTPKYLIEDLLIKGNLLINNTGVLECGNYNLTVDGTTDVANFNGNTIFRSTLSKVGSGNLTFKGTFRTNNVSSAVNFTGNPDIEFQGGFALKNDSIINLGMGNISFTTNNQTLTFNSGPSYSVTIHNPNISIVGDITVTNNGQYIQFNGTINGTTSGSTLVNNGILYFGSNAVQMSTGVFTYNNSSSSAIGYAFDGNYTLPYTNYAKIAVSGTGIKTPDPAATWTDLQIATGTFALSANKSMTGGVSISYAGTLECSGYDLTVGGATSISFQGTFSKNGSGKLTFIGNLSCVDVSSKINLPGNPIMEFRNGISLATDGIYNLGNGDIKFTTNDQSINSTGGGVPSLLLSNNILISGVITLTHTSGFQTQLIGSLDGDNLGSKFKNQNLFYYYNIQQPMHTGVLDCNTIANTFVYAKNGAQNITPGTYRNLSIIGNGVKKLLGNVSILNTYTLSSPAILDTNGFILTNP